jgi:hypothetical protein
MEFTPSNTKLKNVWGGGEGGGEGEDIYTLHFIYGFEIIPWHLHLPIHTLLTNGRNHQPEVACCVTICQLWWH